jgi:hypothetical protein
MNRRFLSTRALYKAYCSVNARCWRGGGYIVCLFEIVHLDLGIGELLVGTFISVPGFIFRHSRSASGVSTSLIANEGEKGVLLCLHFLERFLMPYHLIPELVLRHRQLLVRDALRTKLGRLGKNNLTVKRERTT